MPDFSKKLNLKVETLGKNTHRQFPDFFFHLKKIREIVDVYFFLKFQRLNSIFWANQGFLVQNEVRNEITRSNWLKTYNQVF